MGTSNLRKKALHVYTAQGEDNTVLERGSFYLYISGISYVRNVQPIYIKGGKGSMHKCHTHFFMRSSEISREEVTRNRENGSILAKYFKGQEDQFKPGIKVTTMWKW